jgi:hypothetical protein
MLLILGACSSDKTSTSSSVAPTTSAAAAVTTAAGTDTTAAGTDTTAAGTDTTAAGTDTTAAGTDTTAAGTDTTGAPADTVPGAHEGQVIPDGVSMVGTGEPPEGSGLLSQAALDQPTCNPNGRTNLNVVGGGPFCVNPWPAGSDNGGATAQGVTATEVSIIAYVPNAEMIGADAATAAPPKNQATGEGATAAEAIADQLELENYLTDTVGSFQLWGRKPKIEIVEASGPDETAQRADALAVIAKHPFMVVDMTGTAKNGAPVFSAAVANEKIVTVSASSTATVGQQQSPYRWNYGSDKDAGVLLTAAFIGKTLADNPAKYAGDDSLTGQTRSFGAVYPSSDFDLEAFQKSVTDSGGPTLADSVEFDPADAAQTGEQAPTMVNHLKSAGVTSVLLFGDSALITPLMAAATAQDYHPEWIFTGYAFQDFDLFASGYDQDQMRHAFGVSSLFPYLVPGEQYGYLELFPWYWGQDKGHIWAIASGLTNFVYTSMHYAGPTLTADNLKLGMFSYPAVGGAAGHTAVFQTGYGNTTGMPYPEYSQLGTDAGLVWWNADKPGLSQVIGIPVTGTFQYLNGGQRYGYTDFPDDEPAFFDPSTAVDQLDVTSQFAGGVVPEATPCDGCPANS